MTAAGELWAHYLCHFNFSQLGWLFNTFQEAAVDDKLITEDAFTTIVNEWLAFQWPGVLHAPYALPELVGLALEGLPLPLDFERFVEALSAYQETHVEHEEHAGFDPDNLSSLQDLYDLHNGMTIDDGLKGKQLFAVLDDLGIQFHSKEERAWYVETVTRFDRDASGTINFVELCQIIRKVINMEEEKTRRRQFDLIKESGLPFHEVEDWNTLFNSKDQSGRGELELSQVKDLVTGLGVKWDKEVSDKIIQWIGESDQNQNGTIDFGEFCLVISQMWAANLHNIRGAARNMLVKDRTVSLRTVHGSFLAASEDGVVTAPRSEAGEAETFVMKRKPNGNVCLASRWGNFISVVETDVDAKRSDGGTEFKVATLEDERITLTASTPMGGPLFVGTDGSVAVSDGNPDDVPFTMFSIVSHEDLHKKCWSKDMSKPPKPVSVEARRKSKSPRDVEALMLSPGMKQAADDIDTALESHRLSSARS